MSHLHLYLNGKCGEQNGGTEIDISQLLNIGSPSKAYWWQQQFFSGSGVVFDSISKARIPFVKKIYVRCDDGYRVVVGTITPSFGASGTSLGVASQYYLESSKDTPRYTFDTYSGCGFLNDAKLYYTEEEVEKALGENVTNMKRDDGPIDLSKYNITNANACILLVVDTQNDKWRALNDAGDFLTFSFSEEEV